MLKGYEVRFFQVGKESKGGDAILIRLVDEIDGEKVIVIDGGYKETGDRIIEYLYSLNINTIDLIINTHPDIDHISGLIRLFEEDGLSIKKLIMNRPWRDSGIKADYFTDGRITNKSVNKRMTAAFKFAYDLERAAISKIGESNIVRPVVGNTYYNCLTILSPSTEFYREKLLQSDKTPTTIGDNDTNLFVRPMLNSMPYIRGHLQWIKEETSAINETSIVTLLYTEDRNYLFTGDVGENGLSQALIAKASILRTRNAQINVMQLPHHGSRKNVTPALIRQIGARCYIISCPPKGLEKHHPSRRLVNMVIEEIPTAHIYNTIGSDSFVFFDNLPIAASCVMPMAAFNTVECY